MWKFSQIFFFQLDFTARKRCFLKSAQKNYFSGGGITEQQKQPKFVSLKDFKMKNWGGEIIDIIPCKIYILQFLSHNEVGVP